MIGSGVAFLILAACLTYWWVVIHGSVIVPDLRGKPWTVAQKLAHDGGLGVGRTNLNASTGAPGLVLMQDPMPGTHVKPRMIKGRLVAPIVQLSVPGGADLVPVPQVVGLTATQAERLVARAHLSYSAAGQKPDLTHAAGVIIEQEPAVGTEVLKDSSVNVYVSSGAAMRSVPDLRSKPLPVAIALAEDSGFTVERAGEESRSVPLAEAAAQGLKGIPMVLLQDPPAGSPVDPSTTNIKVIVRANEMNLAPTLVGQTLAKARSNLTDPLSMSIHVTEGKDEDKCVITQQDPPAGARVEGGSIAVSTSEQIAIPTLEGRTLQEAYTLAVQAGALLHVVESSNKAEPGVILTQTPAAGESKPADPPPLITVDVARVTYANSAPQAKASPSPRASAAPGAAGRK